MHIHDHTEIGGEQITDRADDEIVEPLAARPVKRQEGTDIEGETHEIEPGSTDRLTLVRPELKPRCGECRIHVGAVLVHIGPSERMRNADPATEYR